MSAIKEIVISFENLTDQEQLELWSDLWRFASKKLPPEKVMTVTVKTK